MTSPSPSTSVSEPAAERGSPNALLLSLWAAGAVLTLCRAEDLRDWVLESDRGVWASNAADGLVELSDRTGVTRLRSQSEALRAKLYGVHAAAPAPAPPPPPLAAATMEAAAVLEPAHEVAPRPTRVLLVGASSMQFALGQALEKQLAAFEGLEVRRLGKASTGLARPEAFNWPARLEELLEEHKPDLVIVNFGGNDAQNIPLPNRQRAEFGTEAWDRVYGERVADFVARIRARNAEAVLIGMPIMRSPDFTKRMQRLNDVTEKATRAAGGIYLDQWDLAATPAGKYRERVEERGKSLPMRLEDGVHYTEPGGRYVVARLLPRLQHHVQLVPKDANLARVLH